MGAKFDQWLARPSTLRFLRQVLNIDRQTHPKRVQDGLQYRGTHRLSFRKVITSEDRQRESNVGKEGGSKQERGESNGLLRLENPALYMSLKAGVPFVGKDIAEDQSNAQVYYQTKLRHSDTMGPLLVDDPEHQNNFKLWIEILQSRQRTHGRRDVLDVWKAMRNRAIDLPVSGEDADVLWPTFIYAAISTGENPGRTAHRFLKTIFNYAVDLKGRTGLQFQGLYKCIVGRLLRLEHQWAQDLAFQYSQWFREAGLQLPDDMASIVQDAMLGPSEALPTLRKIYSDGIQRNLYDACITEALKLDDDAGALYVHQMLIRAGDAPTTQMFSAPGVQRLFDLDKNRSLPMRSSTRDRKHNLGASDLQALKPDFPPITRASMNAIVGDVHGIRPKEISDHFCARLFATRAFSVDLVIKALSIFGVEKLGPLALREMAIRCDGSPAELTNKVNHAKGHGVALGDDVYSKIISTIAKDGQASLMTALLESDQHPEAYSDVLTQEALLKSFLKQHDWANAHLALLALMLAGASSHLQAWNHLLRHYIQQQEYRPMLSTYQSMQNQKIILLPESLKDMFWQVLPERAHGKRPTKGQGPMFFDPLDFVAKAFVYASENGSAVSSAMWREILKRYGKDHRWDGVERLVLWLVDHYSPDNSARMLGLGRGLFRHRKRIYERAYILQDIFTPQMRRALFTWSFRSASVRDKLVPLPNSSTAQSEQGLSSTVSQPEPWARGLALQKKLSDLKTCDIPFPVVDIRKSFVLRMWILFGPAYSTLGLNNEARRLNRLSLAHYIKHANEIWNGLIDWLDPVLFEKDRRREEELLLAFFGRYKRVSLKRLEYVDVGAWVHRLAALKSKKIYVKSMTPAQQAAWEQSGLRRVWAPSEPGKFRKVHVPGPRANDRRHSPERQSLAAPQASSHQPPSQLYNPVWS